MPKTIIIEDILCSTNNTAMKRSIYAVAFLILSSSSHASSEEDLLCLYGSRGYSKDAVKSSCAFASHYANPSSVISPTPSLIGCNLPYAKLCPSRVQPSVCRTQPPARSAYVGLTCRAAISTSSKDPRSDNKDTAFEQQQSNPNEPTERLVIIIGGTGFLGSEIRKQLEDRGIQYIATTTPATFRRMGEKDKFVSLDLTTENAQQDFYNIISNAMNGDDTSAKEVAIIAAMGSIGTKDDEKVNAALTKAIKAASAHDDFVKSFLMIGNAKRVRRLARKVSFLKGYAEGKDEAEATLKELFGESGCIIKVR